MTRKLNRDKYETLSTAKRISTGGTYMNMSFRDAALKVLQDEGHPLHYEDIARLAIEREYIDPKGKTPGDSISTELSRDIRKKGIKSEFIKMDKGVYSLREFPSGTVSEKPVESWPSHRDIVL